jgi:glycerol-1-phosphate dehydrogenase [NAD(P)+]
MTILVKLISLNGLAISLMLESTPFSGFEHVMSHMLDLEREMQATCFLLHGAQVGLTTINWCRLYQYMLSNLNPKASILVNAFLPARLWKIILRIVYSIDPTGKAGAESCEIIKSNLKNGKIITKY